MPALSSLNVYRHDRGHHATITLAGELDLDAAPALREMVENCLRERIRTIDIDLSALDFCDVSGLNAFLAAAERIASQGGSLRLHHLPPVMARLLELSDTASVLCAAHPAPACRPASDPMTADCPGLLAS
jgi:anti-sigma B factor antagonist